MSIGCGGFRKLVAVYALVLAAGLISPRGALAQVLPVESIGQAASRAGQEMELRRLVAEQVVAAREQAAGRAFDAVYRGNLIDNLSEMPLDTLQAALRDGEIPKAPGDTGSDLVYVPVAPCRAFDTRGITGGWVPAGSTVSFKVTGTLAGQGGAADCGVPFGVGAATAVVLNITATAYPGTGWLSVGPYPDPVPASTSTINFALGMGAAVANATVLKICDPAVSTCTNDLSFQPGAAGTHIIGDVVGYFRALAPTPFKRTRTGAFTTVPAAGPGNYTTVNDLPFTPKFSGEVLLRGRGHCEVTPNGVLTKVAVFAGSSAADAFASFNADEYGLIAPAATDLGGGVVVVPYSFDRVITVTRGVASKAYAFAHKLEGTATVRCRGSLVVESLF